MIFPVVEFPSWLQDDNTKDVSHVVVTIVVRTSTKWSVSTETRSRTYKVVSTRSRLLYSVIPSSSSKSVCQEVICQASVDRLLVLSDHFLRWNYPRRYTLIWLCSVSAWRNYASISFQRVYDKTHCRKTSQHRRTSRSMTVHYVWRLPCRFVSAGHSWARWSYSIRRSLYPKTHFLLIYDHDDSVRWTSRQTLSSLAQRSTRPFSVFSRYVSWLEQ